MPTVLPPSHPARNPNALRILNYAGANFGDGRTSLDISAVFDTVLNTHRDDVIDLSLLDPGMHPAYDFGNPAFIDSPTETQMEGFLPIRMPNTAIDSTREWMQFRLDVPPTCDVFYLEYSMYGIKIGGPDYFRSLHQGTIYVKEVSPSLPLDQGFINPDTVDATALTSINWPDPIIDPSRNNFVYVIPVVGGSSYQIAIPIAITYNFVSPTYDPPYTKLTKFRASVSSKVRHNQIDYVGQPPTMTWEDPLTLHPSAIELNPVMDGSTVIGYDSSGLLINQTYAIFMEGTEDLVFIKYTHDNQEDIIAAFDALNLSYLSYTGPQNARYLTLSYAAPNQEGTGFPVWENQMDNPSFPAGEPHATYLRTPRRGYYYFVLTPDVVFPMYEYPEQPSIPDGEGLRVIVEKTLPRVQVAPFGPTEYSPDEPVGGTDHLCRYVDLPADTMSGTVLIAAPDIQYDISQGSASVVPDNPEYIILAALGRVPTIDDFDIAEDSFNTSYPDSYDQASRLLNFQASDFGLPSLEGRLYFLILRRVNYKVYSDLLGVSTPFFDTSTIQGSRQCGYRLDLTLRVMYNRLEPLTPDVASDNPTQRYPLHNLSVSPEVRMQFQVNVPANCMGFTYRTFYSGVLSEQDLLILRNLHAKSFDQESQWPTDRIVRPFADQHTGTEDELRYPQTSVSEFGQMLYRDSSLKPVGTLVSEMIDDGVVEAFSVVSGRRMDSTLPTTVWMADIEAMASGYFAKPIAIEKSVIVDLLIPEPMTTGIPVQVDFNVQEHVASEFYFDVATTEKVDILIQESGDSSYYDILLNKDAPALNRSQADLHISSSQTFSPITEGSRLILEGAFGNAGRWYVSVVPLTDSDYVTDSGSTLGGFDAKYNPSPVSLLLSRETYETGGDGGGGGEIPIDPPFDGQDVVETTLGILDPTKGFMAENFCFNLWINSALQDPSTPYTGPDPYHSYLLTLETDVAALLDYQGTGELILNSVLLSSTIAGVMYAGAGVADDRQDIMVSNFRNTQSKMLDFDQMGSDYQPDPMIREFLTRWYQEGLIILVAAGSTASSLSLVYGVYGGESVVTQPVTIVIQPLQIVDDPQQLVIPMIVDSDFSIEGPPDFPPIDNPPIGV